MAPKRLYSTCTHVGTDPGNAKCLLNAEYPSSKCCDLEHHFTLFTTVSVTRDLMHPPHQAMGKLLPRRVIAHVKAHHAMPQSLPSWRSHGKTSLHRLVWTEWDLQQRYRACTLDKISSVAAAAQIHQHGFSPMIMNEHL